MSGRTGRLHGVGVLVTRPEPAAGRLADAFVDEGAEVFRVPALAIAPVDDTGSAERLRERLAEVSAVVFTSVNAVDGFFRLPCGGEQARLPQEVLAVGEATARALRLHGVTEVRTPTGRFDSEGLLACPQLAAGRVAGRLVAVVKGEGGRDLLARELRSRGAQVLEANVYRRRAPAAMAETLERVRDSVDVVTATSAETLENLLDAAPWTTSWLARRTVVTVSERIAGIGRARNLSRIAVARGADAASIVEATARAVASSTRDGARPGDAPSDHG